MSTGHLRRHRVPTALHTLGVLLAGGVAAGLPAGAALAHDGMLPYCVGTVSCGMGGAGVALPSDATSIATNPAATGAVGNNLAGGMGFFHTDRTKDTSGGPNLGPFTVASLTPKETSKNEYYPDGALAATYQVTPEIALGLAFYPGGGGETKYNTARTSAGQAFGYDNNVRIRYFLASPTLSWTPNKTVSFGVGLVAGYQDFHTDFATLPALAQTTGRDRDDDAFGWGGKIGMLLHVFDDLDFGAAYATPVNFGRLDKYRDVFISSVDLPQTVQAGFAYRPMPGTTLAIDGKYVGWSDVKAIGTQPAAGGFGWQDQYILKLGVQQELDPQWTVRAGWSWTNSPIPDKNIFANTLFPAINQHHLTAGLTYAWSEALQISGSAYWSPRASQTDDGSGDMFSTVGRGTSISHMQYGMTVGASYRF